MRALALFVLVLGVSGLVLGCQTGTDADETDEPVRDEPAVTGWSLRLETSGGIAGRGQGSIAIRSDGDVELTTMNGDVCSVTAGETLIANLDDAIAAAAPAGWNDEYTFDRGADMFHYTLTLEREDGGRQVVGWHDGSAIPDDLERLWGVIRDVWNEVDCSPGA